MLTILEAIGTALKAIFATPERIFIAAVPIVLALAGGAVLTYRHERDTARSDLVQARLDAACAQVKAVDDARLEEQRRTAAGSGGQSNDYRTLRRYLRGGGQKLTKIAAFEVRAAGVDLEQVADVSASAILRGYSRRIICCL